MLEPSSPGVQSFLIYITNYSYLFSTLKAKIQSFQLFDADLLSRENQSQNRERVFARNLHQKSSVKCPDNDHPGPAW